MADVYHNGIVTDAAVLPPYLFIETLFADDFIRIFHKIGEEKKFPSCQGELRTGFVCPSALPVNGKRTRTQNSGAAGETGRIFLPAQLSLDSENHFPGTEGLGDIVITAAGEP